MRQGFWGVRWACATILPWCLATGLLVSFTASAGIDPSGGTSRMLRTDSAGALAYVALGPQTTDMALLIAPNVDLDRLHSRLSERRGLLPEVGQGVSAPNPELKRSAAAYPTVERRLKGDPLVTLRPGIGGESRDWRHAATGVSILGREVAASFEPGDPWTNEMARSAGFTRWTVEDGATAPVPHGAFTSARDIVSATTRAKLTAGNPDGGTPAAPRAIRLASTTPVPPDSTPMEIAAVPVSFPDFATDGGRDRGHKTGGLTAVARRDEADKPNYAELIDPGNMSREERCLSEAVYFEARSEPEAGQAAVAQVVLNRVRSGLYPASICGVVYQNRNRYLGCQFTFACEGKSLRVTEAEPWRRATRIAHDVLNGQTYLSQVGSSTNYHADYVRPSWARRLEKTGVIGRHIFYKPRDG